jgi:hypothetical protein
MVDVARFNAGTALPPVTMTSTFIRTNSAAISAKRSGRPSAQRCSIARLRPSIQPSSRIRCANAVSHGPCVTGVPVPRKPTVRLSGCCARAASGHATGAAAAPPISLMTSRRFMNVAPLTPRAYHIDTRK